MPKASGDGLADEPDTSYLTYPALALSGKVPDTRSPRFPGLAPYSTLLGTLPALHSRRGHLTWDSYAAPGHRFYPDWHRPTATLLTPRSRSQRLSSIYYLEGYRWFGRANGLPTTRHFTPTIPPTAKTHGKGATETASDKTFADDMPNFKAILAALLHGATTTPNTPWEHRVVIASSGLRRCDWFSDENGIRRGHLT